MFNEKPLEKTPNDSSKKKPKIIITHNIEADQNDD
jgi:hypothetical protein